MTVVRDPEGNETNILQKFVHFKDKTILEIGCGDGRLTWSYAEHTRHITAIDPDPDEIALAVEDRPAHLRNRVEFLVRDINDFDLKEVSSTFDIALLSWAL
jgi:2-polyprenyl-3-methyl-5-hydroxy-6-metoxy-1,4-benzoquinol methylase